MHYKLQEVHVFKIEFVARKEIYRLMKRKLAKGTNLSF